jgi:maleylacetate reductase
VLGGAIDLPHAETRAIVLPHVVSFLEPALDAGARSQIASATASVRPSTSPALAVFELTAMLQLPRRLREVGANNDAPELTEMSASNSPRRRPGHQPMGTCAGSLPTRSRANPKPDAKSTPANSDS